MRDDETETEGLLGEVSGLRHEGPSHSGFEPDAEPGVRGGRRLIKIFVLFSIALALGVGALILLPGDSPVAATGGLEGIAFAGDFVPSSIDVDVTPDTAAHGVSLSVLVVGAPATGAVANVTLTTGSKQWFVHSHCPKGAQSCQPYSYGSEDAAFLLTPVTLDGERTETLSVTVARVGQGVSQNDEYVSVVRPPVTYEYVPLTSAPSVAENNVPVTYDLALPHGDTYSWEAGFAAPTYGAGDEYWNFLSGNTNQIVDSGVNVGIEGSDGRNLFIAGAFLGVAGAALVTGIEHTVILFEERPSRRRRRRARRPPD